MGIRIGKVTNIYSAEGKVKVMYEDEKSASLPLAMLTMNREYSMPEVGDRVVTMHMENGSSKGFVLGSYYGGGMKPNADGGYRKDFGNGSYVTVNNGGYVLSAAGIRLLADGAVTLSAGKETAELILDADTVLKAESVTLEAENITFKCSYGTISAEEIVKRLERIEDSLGLTHTL